MPKTAIKTDAHSLRDNAAYKAKRAAKQSEVQIALLPKQKVFVEAHQQECLYSGAFGAGKTRALCYKLLTHAVIPGNFVGLCRKTFTAMRHSTLRTLLTAESGLEPVLPEGSYKHNKSDHTIKINGGGTICYFGIDKAESLGSYNFGAIGVDEMTELSETEYLMLMGRLRNIADPHRQIFGVTNPEGPTHFIYKRFFQERTATRYAIEATSLENHLLPADYLQSLSEFTGQARDRYVLGKWCAFEGLVFDMFNPAANMRVRQPSEMKSFYIGVDEGYTNPATVLVIGRDGDGRYHIFDEWYERKALPEKHLDTIERKYSKWNAVTVYPDPSAAGLIASIKARGMSVSESNNAINFGIGELQNLLVPAGDGIPRLTADPSCFNWRMEMESYRWRKIKDVLTDTPVDEMDHLIDPTRYIIASLAGKGDATPMRPRTTKERFAQSRKRLVM